jgi:hypothetical protein
VVPCQRGKSEPVETRRIRGASGPTPPRAGVAGNGLRSSRADLPGAPGAGKPGPFRQHAGSPPPASQVLSAGKPHPLRRHAP